MATRKKTTLPILPTCDSDENCPELPDHVSAAEALKLLKEGNKRYLKGREQQRCQETRRSTYHYGQNPWAIVLTCADSRVSPELIFDVGIGELFVVRVAGNIANACSIASIEYAVANLDVELIVVLGHEDCGAIKAALEGEAHTYNLNQLLGHLAPVADEFGAKWKAARSKLKKRAIEYDASEDNARNVAQQLKHQSPEILLPNDKLDIVPAVYQTGSGQVDWERKYAWA
jgi:carbonic anhydrase